MPTCFVIQPFDRGAYDKRYHEIFVPAIKAAGLEPYRVDHDPSVSVPIDGIEEGIVGSAVCIADITEDNPNVWYELGYAFASKKPVCMVCSIERQGKKYPFDIQHRTITSYGAQSPSDFSALEAKLTERLKAILVQEARLEKIAAADPVKAVDGLSQPELAAIAIIGGESFSPDDAVSLRYAAREAEKAGLTQLGFNVALRRLLNKSFVAIDVAHDPHDGEEFKVVALTDSGWDWVEKNDKLFNLNKPSDEDDIPF